MKGGVGAIVSWATEGVVGKKYRWLGFVCYELGINHFTTRNILLICRKTGDAGKMESKEMWKLIVCLITNDGKWNIKNQTRLFTSAFPLITVATIELIV